VSDSSRASRSMDAVGKDPSRPPAVVFASLMPEKSAVRTRLGSHSPARPPRGVREGRGAPCPRPHVRGRSRACGASPTESRAPARRLWRRDDVVLHDRPRRAPLARTLPRAANPLRASRSPVRLHGDPADRPMGTERGAPPIVAKARTAWFLATCERAFYRGPRERKAPPARASRTSQGSPRDSQIATSSGTPASDRVAALPRGERTVRGPDRLRRERVPGVAAPAREGLLAGSPRASGRPRVARSRWRAASS